MRETSVSIKSLLELDNDGCLWLICLNLKIYSKEKLGGAEPYFNLKAFLKKNLLPGSGN